MFSNHCKDSFNVKTAFARWQGNTFLGPLYLLNTLSYALLISFSILCSSFRWTKNGTEFNPASDPELKVSERPGSSVFYTLSNTLDNLKQYQGKYVCYASNELGTAVSNEAILNTECKNTVTVDRATTVTGKESLQFEG